MRIDVKIDGVPRPASIACDERTGVSSGAKNNSVERALNAFEESHRSSVEEAGKQSKVLRQRRDS